MAKLIKPLFAAPNGEVYPRTIPQGEECPPELEDAAREAGALEEEVDPGQPTGTGPADPRQAAGQPTAGDQVPDAKPAAEPAKAETGKAKASK